MSASHKGKTHSEETKIKMKKPKPIEDTKRKHKSFRIGNMVFISQIEASNYFGVSRPIMSRALKKGFYRGMKVEKYE